MIKQLRVREMEHWFALLYAELKKKCRAQYTPVWQCFLLNTTLSKSHINIYIYIYYTYSVVDIFLLLLLLYTLVFIVHLFMFILLSFYLLTKKKLSILFCRVFFPRVFFFIVRIFQIYSLSAKNQNKNLNYR